MSPDIATDEADQPIPDQSHVYRFIQSNSQKRLFAFFIHYTTAERATELQRRQRLGGRAAQIVTGLVAAPADGVEDIGDFAWQNLRCGEALEQLMGGFPAIPIIDPG